MMRRKNGWARLHRLLAAGLLLAGLAACSGEQGDEKLGYASAADGKLAQGMADLTRPVKIGSGPVKSLVYGARNLEQFTRPRDLNRYVCGGVATHLQRRHAQANDYSDTFAIRVLGELPLTLQATYATCYLEQTLKQGGFAGYFKDSGGFLVGQAYTGYLDFRAPERAKIVKAAADTWLKSLEQKPDKARSAELKREYARYDLLWKALDEQALIAQRATFIRSMFDEGAWPLKPGRS